MEALGVAVAVCFAWACIATSVALAQAHRADLYANALRETREREEAHADRAMAYSLSEFRTFRPVVTEIAHPEAPQRYASDPFGMLVEPVSDDE